MVSVEPIPIALRAYPAPPPAERPTKSRKPWAIPEDMLVFDTETRIDASQRLTFGSYRFIASGRSLEEGLFYAGDLPVRDRETLEQYTSTHFPEVVREGHQRLLLLTLRQFLDKFYKAAYKGRSLVVAFNFPFDVSRIAHDFRPARGRFAGGFSLGLWTYADDAANYKASQYRPRIGIKQIDSKRALKGFTARKEPDDVDLIPEDSLTGEPEPGYKFRGHFLDLRTLAFALTDRGYSLETACAAFGVEHPKSPAQRHGIVTPEYIDYNRRDVQATCELAEKLLEEYGKHPIALQATRAYSPASIGKAYLREMGITPVLERQPDFPKRYLGYAQSAFFGGRTSAHIRRMPVPVVYTDFLSMYPTVNSLMDLWRFVTAPDIKVVKHCQAEIKAFLSRVTADDFFKRANWKKLTAFVRIIPGDDIVPTRGKYSVQSHDWQVAVNHLSAGGHGPNDALWFSLPDLVASVLLTGRVPRIVDAFRIEPRGQLTGLRPIKLRGAIEIDPKKQDFFRVVIEERKRLSSRHGLGAKERERLDKALKVLANAASYGIYAEMNRQESDRNVKVKCYGIDPDPFTCSVSHPDVPGEYCFAPLASLITGAARLMLALLEHCVSEHGGTYAMEDTDSMAIVATEHGGSIPGSRTAIKALSWTQVEAISRRFSTLNPYDSDAVPGSILKIEEDNHDPKTGKQRQLYCLAISAKRYDLFVKDRQGNPILLRNGLNNKADRWSEHGLGHLLNPTDPESEDREWIAHAWLNMSRKALDLETQSLGFEDLPAIGRTTVSSPAVMQPLTKLNEGKQYADQIKPSNFLLTCHVRPLGHPIGADPEHFHLIAPYESDPREWLKMQWIDQYTGKTYRITTVGHHGSRNTARVKTYGDVLREYEFHAELKCADAHGSPSGKQTIGLLQRRHVRIDQIKYIGKESNSLEDVESGLIHSEENVYTEYPDPRRDEFRAKTLPRLKRIPLSQLAKMSGLSRSALKDVRAGRSRPHPNNQQILIEICRNLEQKSLHYPRKDKLRIYALQESGRQAKMGARTSRTAKREKKKSTVSTADGTE